jgi:hypothetical protein
MPLLNYMMMKNCGPSFENSQTLVESKCPFEDGQKGLKKYLPVLVCIQVNSQK